MSLTHIIVFPGCLYVQGGGRTTYICVYIYVVSVYMYVYICGKCISYAVLMYACVYVNLMFVCYVCMYVGRAKNHSCGVILLYLMCRTKNIHEFGLPTICMSECQSVRKPK